VDFAIRNDRVEPAVAVQIDEDEGSWSKRFVEAE
jgi:hypothetical protein